MLTFSESLRAHLSEVVLIDKEYFGVHQFCEMIKESCNRRAELLQYPPVVVFSSAKAQSVLVLGGREQQVPLYIF